MNVHKYDAPTEENAGPLGSLWVWMPVEYQWRLCHWSRVKKGDYWTDFESIPIPQDIPVGELIAPIAPPETEEERKSRLDDQLREFLDRLMDENPDLFKIPVLPKWPIGPDEFPRPGDFPTDAPIGKCNTCGIELFQVMGYACPRSDCPTGMGPIMCTTTEGTDGQRRN